MVTGPALRDRIEARIEKLRARAHRLYLAAAGFAIIAVLALIIGGIAYAPPRVMDDLPDATVIPPALAVRTMDHFVSTPPFSSSPIFEREVQVDGHAETLYVSALRIQFGTLADLARTQDAYVASCLRAQIESPGFCRGPGRDRITGEDRWLVVDPDSLPVEERDMIAYVEAQQALSRQAPEAMTQALARFSGHWRQLTPLDRRKLRAMLDDLDARHIRYALPVAERLAAPAPYPAEQVRERAYRRTMLRTVAQALLLIAAGVAAIAFRRRRSVRILATAVARQRGAPALA